VLAYLSRYAHRVAIANSRLIACDQQGVTFKWKDYRVEGRDRYKRMTLITDEFIRRFLIHVLPKACTASVTTACSPKALAPTTLFLPVSYLPPQTLKACPPLPMPASRLVHAAVVV
jgi:Putative transposase